MMVVIVVSRRVGQVTLAVSERTSCRNLNGLKAIEVPRPSPDELTSVDTGIRTAAKPPNPRLKDEPESGLAGSGIYLRPRRISAFRSGPAAGGGYVLPW